MTDPKPLQLVPIAVAVDAGMIESTGDVRRAYNYQLGLDGDGRIYLIYRHTWPSIRANRPRLSVYDPHWSPFHGLRYIEWVTP